MQLIIASWPENASTRASDGYESSIVMTRTFEGNFPLEDARCKVETVKEDSLTNACSMMDPIEPVAPTTRILLKGEDMSEVKNKGNGMNGMN
jgi:hypothetical protein